MSRHYIIQLNSGFYKVSGKDLSKLLKIASRSQEVNYTKDYRGKKVVRSDEARPFIEGGSLENLEEESEEDCLAPSPRPDF